MHESPGVAHVPGDQHDHPTARVYILVAVLLTVLTGLEIGVYVVPVLRPVLVPLLFLLAGAKFAVVAGWYMHLRFDPKLLTWLFVGGLITAAATIGGLTAMFNGWGG